MTEELSAIPSVTVISPFPIISTLPAVINNTLVFSPVIVLPFRAITKSLFRVIVVATVRLSAKTTPFTSSAKAAKSSAFETTENVEAASSPQIVQTLIALPSFTVSHNCDHAHWYHHML